MFPWVEGPENAGLGKPWDSPDELDRVVGERPPPLSLLTPPP